MEPEPSQQTVGHQLGWGFLGVCITVFGLVAPLWIPEISMFDSEDVLLAQGDGETTSFEVVLPERGECEVYVNIILESSNSGELSAGNFVPCGANVVWRGVEDTDKIWVNLSDDGRSITLETDWVMTEDQVAHVELDDGNEVLWMVAAALPFIIALGTFIGGLVALAKGRNAKAFVLGQLVGILVAFMVALLASLVYLLTSGA